MILRKIFLACSSVFVGDSNLHVRGLFGITILIISLRLVDHLKPYMSEHLNRVEYLSTLASVSNSNVIVLARHCTIWATFH
jgi:hypothetical protein